jgi:DNA (cytosine-5)-methyltransferase 1
MQLGSLFDGIGAFPLSASKHGIKAVWASEIEPFPIKVTSLRFPDMKHIGDVTKINGADIEPVDIITFGSPCQDLSVAGKRGGLQGERSGLFSHAVRIIREMRDSTGGQYPRFAIWENVPGAFSSNGGEDFRAVLAEIAEAEIPMPASGKWANAGMVRTERVDVAWRTLDAQYWGVPQRRKRIFLVADFGGRCAGEILFKPSCVSWNSQAGRKAREEAAATVGDGIEESNCLTPWDVQSRRIHDVNGKWPSLYGGEGGGHGYVAQCVTSGTGRRYDPETETLIPILYDMTHAEEVMRPVKKGIAPTLNSRMGTGGNQVPVMLAFGPGGQHEVSHAIRSQPSKADKPDSTTYVIQNATRGKSQNGLGISQEDVSYTLDSLGNHAVATVDCRNLYENEEISATIQSKPNGGHSLNYQNPVRIGYRVRRLTPLECERLMGFPDGWTDIPGASDTARYKALGNSIAIPCLDYIFEGMSKVIEEGRA